MAPLTYSDEQSAYIFTECRGNTKLLATAGSGKTFCIIHRICNIVKTKVSDPEEIYMLTFSKNAKDDFRTKVRQLHLTETILPKNVCTIDSFAYSMIGTEIASTIDISLLSVAWLDELENTSDGDLLIKYPRLQTIKMVFVDEAQDLNEIQYNILMRMQSVCKDMTIHMVGDPNQNIYQFRKASDKYLVNFSAQVFLLTTNYRSMPHIVKFCSHMRPYNKCDINANLPVTTKMAVTFYAYDNASSFEYLLMSCIKMFQERNIPLHKVAILAPTRGYIRNHIGLCRYKGLCYIANLLFQKHIPFKQFYSDTNNSEAFEGARVKYKYTPDHINLMTYTSSKGLEWDYVLLIDANAHLISRIEYDEARFRAEQYLLYVACSRPRKNLIVFTKSKNANPWFKSIPDDTYKVAPMCLERFDFFDKSKLYDSITPSSQIKTSQLMTPNTILNLLTTDQLYIFDKQLRGRHMVAPIKPFNLSTIQANVPESRAPFMRFFMTHLYYTCAKGTPLPDSHTYVVDIFNVISNRNIVLCPHDRTMFWYFENRANMTWDLFNSLKPTLDIRIVDFITKNFDPTQEFNSYTLVDKFYELYIQASIESIKQVYTSYLSDPTSPITVLNMSRIAYAILTTHYFYIKQENDFKIAVFDENIALIDDMIEIAAIHKTTGFLETIKHDIVDEQSGLCYSYDRTNDGRNINIRTRHTLSIKDILHGLMTQHIENPELPFTEFYTLQLSPPALYKYTITISLSERASIFADIMVHRPLLEL
jgi:hypothetical protein